MRRLNRPSDRVTGAYAGPIEPIGTAAVRIAGSTHAQRVPSRNGGPATPTRPVYGTFLPGNDPKVPVPTRFMRPFQKPLAITLLKPRSPKLSHATIDRDARTRYKGDMTQKIAVNTVANDISAAVSRTNPRRRAH